MNCNSNPRVENLLADIEARKKQGPVPGIRVSNELFLDLQDARLTKPIPDTSSLIPKYCLPDGTRIFIDEQLSGGQYRLPPIKKA